MKSEIRELIGKLKIIARDPARATDEGHGFFDDFGNPVHFIASVPLTESIVAGLETKLGFCLPRLIRSLYIDVGNGGFGPGYGLLPLVLNGPTLASHTASDLYFSRRESNEPWPEKIFPAFHAGGGTLCCMRIQDGDDDPEIVRYIPSVDDDWIRRRLKGQVYIGRGFLPEPLRLSQLLTNWVSSKE